MTSIKVAIVGIGNCASSLVQGLAHYRDGANDTIGLMHWDLGGYQPERHQGRRGVGHRQAQGRQGRGRGDLRQAQLHRDLRRRSIEPSGVDGRRWAESSTASPSIWHDYPDDRTFVIADAAEPSKDEVVADAARDRAPTC